MCKESAKELRSKLKELGYSRNMVGVTSDYDSINVTIKSIEVNFKNVEELANNYESIRTDEMTGEILQGGNTYVTVKYEDSLMESLENKYMNKAKEVFETIQSSSELENIFIKDGIHAFLGDFQIIWFRTPQQNGMMKRYKCYNCAEGIAEVFAKLFLNEQIDILEISEPVQEDKNIEEQKEVKTESSEIVEPQQIQITKTNEIEFTVLEDTHTKTGTKIFVAKLIKKIEYAEFKNIESKIKSFGGYYSRFKKGFIFAENPTEALQKEFNNIVNETIDNIETTEQVKEVQPVQQQEIKINEELARRSKENMSFSDYKEGSATQEYNNHIEEVAKEIEEAKTNMSQDSQIKLDNLLNWYKRAYATWINKHNANGSSHVSQMISGAGNYNMRRHEKFISREGKLWEEYNELKNISDKIDKIVNGDKIIRSSDPNAIEKLKNKLQKAEEEHKGYKEYNIQARKEGKEKLSSYVLQNSNARIKVIKDRIKKLERVAM